MFRKKSRNKLRLFSLMFFAAMGCQTIEKKPLATVPAVVDPLFKDCVYQSGSAHLTVLNEKQPLATAELEWLGEGANNIAIGAFDPLSRPYLESLYDGKNAWFKGPMAEHLPELALDENGFLLVNGSWVGIKFREIPCFLGLALPKAWKESFYSMKNEGQDLLFEGGDGFREIMVWIPKPEAPKGAQVCARMSWRHFFKLMKSEIAFCYSRAIKDPKGYLSGISDWSLEWIKGG